MSESKRKPKTGKKQKKSGPKGTARARSNDGRVAPVFTRPSTSPVVGGFGDKALVRLSWARGATLTFNSTTAQRLEYNLNSAFDPGAALASSQPANYDIFAALYERYRVRSVTAEYRIFVGEQGYTPQVGALTYFNGGARVVICPFNATQTLATDDVWTNPRAHMYDVVPAKPIIYNKTWRMSALAGLTETQYCSADRSCALISADPADLILSCVTVQPTKITLTTIDVTIDVNFFMEVEFYQRIPTDGDFAQRALQNRVEYKAHKDKVVTGRTKLGVGYPAATRVMGPEEPQDQKGDTKSSVGGVVSSGTKLSAAKPVGLSLLDMADASEDSDEDETSLIEAMRKCATQKEALQLWSAAQALTKARVSSS